MSASILLIAFYNEKALGVQYLANALKKNGYQPHILFFKEFNSVKPSKITEKELELFRMLIKEIKPSYIGLSVMSSLYLESVCLVNRQIRDHFNIPVIWGGVYATLFPQRALENCNFVIRGEGEGAIVELLDKLEKREDPSCVENLVYTPESGRLVFNDVRPLLQNLDDAGFPDINDEKRYFIHHDSIERGKFMLNSFSYELTTSRGCPFVCSYCSSINLKRLYSEKGKYVRFRSVDSVIEELEIAKKFIKNLSVIHFWDEIFPDEEGWAEEFKDKYIQKIGLPFNIWGHPLKVSERVIRNLVEAGLHQIVVGIQSGSMRIRKEIFNRPESQEQIIQSSEVLSINKVPKIIYDLMLRHPFENIDDLKETFRLCLRLKPPFKLQIHGLNFLPGTDIVNIAVEKGILNMEELEKIMYSNIQQQYDKYWGTADINKVTGSDVWLSLIYLTQFRNLRPLLERFASSAEKVWSSNMILSIRYMAEYLSKLVRLKDKAILVLQKKV